MKRDITAKDSSSMFVIGFLLCQSLVLIANIIAIIIYSTQGIDISTVEMFFNSAVGYLICSIMLNLGMSLCYIYGKRHYNSSTPSKVSWKKCLIYAAIGLSSFLVLYPIISCIDFALISWGINYPTITYEYTTTNYIISLFSLVLFPAVCEELLFRGLIFSGLRKYSKWLSIILSSIMFAIFHMSIYQSIYPLLFGILLSSIMYRENNIIYCIIAHAINNFTSLTLSYLNVSLIFNHWTYILLAVVLCSVWLYVVIRSINKIHSTKSSLTKSEITYIITSLAIMTILWIITISIN